MIQNDEKSISDLTKTIDDAIDATVNTTLVVFILVLIHTIIFCICCKENIKTCIIEIGTSIPLYVILATLITEGVDAVIGRRMVRKAEEKLQRELQREREELHRLQSEWEEWADNGRDPDKRPKLPDIPKPASNDK